MLSFIRISASALLIPHIFGLLWFIGTLRPGVLIAMLLVSSALLTVVVTPSKTVGSFTTYAIAKWISVIGLLGCIYLMLNDITMINGPDYVGFTIRCVVFLLILGFLKSAKLRGGHPERGS